MVMVTGHRPTKLGGYNISNPVSTWVLGCATAILKDLDQTFRPAELITGMALGSDQIFAVAADIVGMPFHAFVPFQDQDAVWPQKSKEDYRYLLGLAKSVRICSEGKYEARKMHIRNEEMVQDCDLAIAVWDGSRGGTGSCVRLLEDYGRPYLVLDPRHITATSSYPILDSAVAAANAVNRP